MEGGWREVRLVGMFFYHCCLTNYLMHLKSLFNAFSICVSTALVFGGD